MDSLGSLYAIVLGTAFVAFTLGCVARALLVKSIKRDSNTILTRMRNNVHDVEFGDEDISEDHDASSILEISSQLSSQNERTREQLTRTDAQRLLTSMDDPNVLDALQRAIFSNRKRD